jgi:hypothetical protein
MDTFFQIYTLFKKDKKKERFDIILEPLQAVTQLALLSFCPKGSKLAISNNLLSIQAPTWGQGLWRSYNNDMKEDLFFLFNAIVRFNRFYIYLKAEPNDYCDLFELLIQLSKRGIDKLLQTYANTEQPALLHTLQLYRILLDNPISLNEPETVSFIEEPLRPKNISKILSEAKTTQEHTRVAQEPAAVGSKKTKAHAQAAEPSSSLPAPAHISLAPVPTSNLDDIFCNIRLLYTTHEFIILYQSLILLEKNPDKYETYIQGITVMMQPIYEKIQKWISDNIVY